MTCLEGVKKRAVAAEYGRTGATIYGNILEGNISFIIETGPADDTHLVPSVPCSISLACSLLNPAFPFLPPLPPTPLPF